MSLGVGAYKVGGAGQCTSMRRRYPWQPCERPPPGTVTLNNSVEYLPTQYLPSPPVRATPTNCSASPEQFGAKLDRNGEGAVDDQRQGHTMSRQLTRQARKSFRRCANIKLVCIASPTSKSLNQVVRNAVASCYRGCPNAEAVAGEIALNPRGRENLPQPIGQDCARQRLTICKKEQGARDISSYGEVCQQSVNSAEGCPSQTNMDVAA